MTGELLPEDDRLRASYLRALAEAEKRVEGIPGWKWVLAYNVAVSVPIGAFCRWFADGWYAAACTIVLGGTAVWFGDVIYRWWRS